MKHYQAILAAAVCGVSALSAQELSVSTTFDFSSAYIFRGAQRAEETFMPAVDISSGNAYLGVWGALPVSDSVNNSRTEVDMYAGYNVEVNELVSLDFGGTLYAYPNSEEFGSNNTFEVYAGASLATMLSPSIYVFYDFDLEDLTVESTIGYSFPLSDAVSFDTSAYLGWVSLGEEKENTAKTKTFSDYAYYGVTGSFAYALAENATASIYANYGGATEERMYEVGDKAAFWFGVAVTTGF